MNKNCYVKLIFYFNKLVFFNIEHEGGEIKVCFDYCVTGKVGRRIKLFLTLLTCKESFPVKAPVTTGRACSATVNELRILPVLFPLADRVARKKSIEVIAIQCWTNERLTY